MTQVKLRKSLASIQALLEDETTDDLTKWRIFCFSQLTKLQYQKLNKKTEISKLNLEKDKLQNTYEEICNAEKEILEKKQEILNSLDTATKEGETMRQQISKACSIQKKSFDLQRAPSLLKTRLEIHKVKMEDEIMKKMNISIATLEKLNFKLVSLKQKVGKINQIIIQNRSKYDQYSKEIQQLQKQIEDIAIPEFSHEIQSLSLKFRNTTEASKTLFAIEDKISNYRSALQKTPKLDYRPSDCSAIESLIEQEKQKQKEIFESIVNQYNTDQIKSEISEMKQKSSELSDLLSEVEQNSSLKLNQINANFNKQEINYQRQIQENEKKIQSLMKKVIDLKKIVPITPNNLINKVQVQTQTAFPLPAFF